MPWLRAKGFDTACPLSGFVPKDKIPDPYNCNLWLKLNNQIKLQGNSNDADAPIKFHIQE